MNERKTFRYIMGLSVVVFIVVVVLFMQPKASHIPSYVKYLPRLNAFINGTCSLLLIISFIFIMKKKVEIHKRLNILAFILSSVFLVSYILFHSFGIETKYPADAPFRSLYLFILLTHILLAATVLPLVLLSFYRGLTGKIALHKKITRWSFPLWLYVTVSGVVVYLMISPYYKF